MKPFLCYVLCYLLNVVILLCSGPSLAPVNTCVWKMINYHLLKARLSTELYVLSSQYMPVLAISSTCNIGSSNEYKHYKLLSLWKMAYLNKRSAVNWRAQIAYRRIFSLILTETSPPPLQFLHYSEAQKKCLQVK